MNEDFNNIKKGVLQKEMEINQIKAENHQLKEDNFYLKKKIDEMTLKEDEIAKNLYLLKKNVKKLTNGKNNENISAFLESKQKY